MQFPTTLTSLFLLTTLASAALVKKRRQGITSYHSTVPKLLHFQPNSYINEGDFLIEVLHISLFITVSIRITTKYYNYITKPYI